MMLNYNRLANQLTLFRLILALVFIALMQVDRAAFATAGLFVFAVASITDIYDGRLARMAGKSSNFGAYFDPLADKVLVSAALIVLAATPYLAIPTWMAIVVIAREFLVTGLRVVGASRGVMMKAETLGKVKTIFQMVALNFILAELAVLMYLRESFPGLVLAESVQAGLTVFYQLLMWGIVVLALWSGIGYFVRHAKLVADDF
ncbi:MAG TPA: CDP-diacylglycerol--glycerol-3-phosphate 3-phosphatidyltransferase [bacterium]|mgnify:CR=1 FL=1|nr:CDP-diacylglycerol--glycerol-3-phosphate 3-phosphatidyltransferase [bacterium]